MVLQLCPVSNINKHWLVTMNNLALFIITWTTEIDRRILIIDLKYVKFDKNKFKKKCTISKYSNEYGTSLVFYVIC